MKLAENNRESPSLPEDSSLPRLALAFDCDRVRDMLQRAIAAAGADRAQVRDCSIERVKYRPGRNCMLLYRARIEDGGQVSEQYFKACIYGAQELAGRFQAARAIAQVPPRYGRAVERVEDLDMVLWAFPNDPKLATLPRLADPEALAEPVQALAVQRFGPAARLESMRLQPAAYFPEHTYTLAVQARICDAGRERPWTLYAKTRVDDRGCAVLLAMEQLWDSPARREGSLAVARPLAYHADERLLWQEAVPGRPLEHLAGCGTALVQHMEPLGRTLAALHRTRVPDLPQLSASDRLGQLQRTVQLLSQACPLLARRLSTLLDRLAATLPAAGACATLHGDLHMNNVLIGDGGPALIDFDSISGGPAALELGGFVAGLLYRGRLHRTPSAAIAAAICELLAGYRRHGAAPGRAELAWHTAAALVQERAFRCLTSLKPGRYELVGALVDEALDWSSDQVSTADLLAA